MIAITSTFGKIAPSSIMYGLDFSPDPIILWKFNKLIRSMSLNFLVLILGVVFFLSGKYHLNRANPKNAMDIIGLKKKKPQVVGVQRD